jgi:hypothetical protein
MEDKEVKKKGKEETAEPVKKEPENKKLEQVKETERVSSKINACYMLPSGSVILDQVQETYKNQKNGIFFMLLELEKRGIL